MLLYNLCRNQDKQERLAAELRQHMPDQSQPLAALHLAKFKYLTATVKESLR